jgi:hypothetical protein
MLLDGVWYTIYKDYYSDDIAYIAEAGNTREYTLLLPVYNLDFKKGTYRVIKLINDEYYSAEFTIK